MTSQEARDKSEFEKQNNQELERDNQEEGDDDDDDNEPDEWDKRIFSTGCAVENEKLNDCFYEKKDWRACKQEMEAFRECWKRQGNDERTQTRNAS